MARAQPFLQYCSFFFIEFLRPLLDDVNLGISFELFGKVLRYLFFADDIIILAKSLDDLKSLLTVILNFCRDWGLDINPSKCEAILFGKLRPPTYSIDVEGFAVEFKKSVKYLGVWFQSTNSWTIQREYVINRVKSVVPRVSVIARNVAATNFNFNLQLYDTLVLSIATYSNIVWCHTGTDRIEGPILRYLKNVLGLPYSTRNNTLSYEFGRMCLKCLSLFRALIYFCTVLSEPKFEGYCEFLTASSSSIGSLCNYLFSSLEERGFPLHFIRDMPAAVLGAKNEARARFLFFAVRHTCAISLLLSRLIIILPIRRRALAGTLVIVEMTDD